MTLSRKERLVCGGRFTDDIRVPGALIATFVRSPHAHAEVLGIASEAACGCPGVAAVITAADIAGDLKPLRCYCPVNGQDGQTNRPADWVILASDRVRYVGDPVACVVADTAAQAETAAHRVRTLYAPLPAYVDPAIAVSEPIWPQAPDNLCFDCATGDQEMTDRLLTGAAHVTRMTLQYPRIIAAPLEPRSIVARFEVATRRFHLQTNCQGTHWLRRVIADALRVAPDRLRVETGDLGGGFGSRIFAYPEHVLLLWLARRLGRPVRWTSSRREAFLTDTQGRDHSYEAEIGLDADGGFLALRVNDTARLGAYLSQYTPYSQSGCGAPVQAGGYRFEALHVRTRGVFTNTAPVDAFRGTGRPEATYVLERLIDQAAFETGRDPAALRAQNLRGRTTTAVTLATGQMVDGGQFLANQERCLAHVDRAGFPTRRATSAARGRLRGFGMANYVEANGSLGIAKLTTGGLPQEAAAFRIDRDGNVTIFVGTQSSGQDHAMPLVRLAAARLGLDPSRIAVQEGDSDALPLGGGTGGSRSTLAGLHALDALLAKLEVRAKEHAARLWELPASAVSIEAGLLSASCSNRSIGFVDLARSDPETFNLTATCRFEHGSFANGCHACEIDIDPNTGTVAVLGYTAVDDFGTVIDEANVRSQVQGGILQGLGTALLETCRSDAIDGRPLAVSFDTYALPCAADTIDVQWIDNGLPSSTAPLGVKACGESAISAAPPAIMNAVVDALRQFPNAGALQMPATPDAIGAIIWRGPSRSRCGVS